MLSLLTLTAVNLYIISLTCVPNFVINFRFNHKIRIMTTLTRETYKPVGKHVRRASVSC